MARHFALNDRLGPPLPHRTTRARARAPQRFEARVLAARFAIDERRAASAALVSVAFRALLERLAALAAFVAAAFFPGAIAGFASGTSAPPTCHPREYGTGPRPEACSRPPQQMSAPLQPVLREFSYEHAARNDARRMIKKRTYVYVDGFNVYYGIRYTPFRWLDLGRLARLTVPNAEISSIRYFTARIEARDDPDQPQQQAIYLRALQTIPDLSIHFGQFRSNQVRMALVDPPPIGPRTALVWKTEEKGSDVNLATYLLADGFEARYEQAVVVSMTAISSSQSESCVTRSVAK